MDNEIAKDNIVLRRFNKEDLNHLMVAKSFKNDSLINEFFSEWEEITNLSINDDTNTFYSYVIYIEDIPAGITTIVFNNDTTVVFSLGFLPEFRGKAYGGKIREMILDYAFSKGIEKVKGYIKVNNERNIKSVNKSGGILTKVPDTDLYEVCYEKPISR